MPACEPNPNPATANHGGWPLIATFVVAIAITLISGLLHGRMTQRWGLDQGLQAAAERLQLFPSQIGAWEQESTLELGQSALELLQCQGYVHRGYRNRETGDYVKLAVMVGPGSKMSIHIPEICYEASNFTLLGPRQRWLIHVDDREDAFWSVRFQINDVSERRVRVLYGWSTGGQWLAPRMPRWSIAAHPVLYKLQLSYVSNDALGSDPQREEDLLRNFLRDVTSILRLQFDSGAAADSPTPHARHDAVAAGR